MKVFAVVVVATVLVQLALAAPSKSCDRSDSRDDSDEKASHRLDHSDRLLIQRAKSGGGFKSGPSKARDDSSEETCGCSGAGKGGSKGGKGGNKAPKWESSESDSESSESHEGPRGGRGGRGHDDDCFQVDRPRTVTTSRCEENDKIYLHRQAPIYVRPPPSRIFINHPPVVVRQPPVILHHQSRSPVLVKPILIKEREVAARPVLFKISKPDNRVSVSKCENPKVHVSGGCSGERKEKPCAREARKEKSCGCN